MHVHCEPVSKGLTNLHLHFRWPGTVLKLPSTWVKSMIGSSTDHSIKMREHGGRTDGKTDLRCDDAEAKAKPKPEIIYSQAGIRADKPSEIGPSECKI